MKGILCMLILGILLYKPGLAQGPGNAKVSLSFENSTILKAIETLEKEYNVNFSYQSNLSELQKNISIKMNFEPLSKVLDFLLLNSGLSYKIFAEQVIIFPPISSVSTKILIEGKLCKTGTLEPISFAGIEIINARKGTISDIHGYFRMETDSKMSDDTLLIQSLNFQALKIPVMHFTITGKHTFFLTEKKYNLPGIDIVGEKGRVEQWGNHKWLPSGSFYLDTHGQQTALYIANEKKETAKLVSVSFYLSKKGNTDAPFRIHIYLRDSISGKPVTEQLHDIIIVKPKNNKGWYTVNLSKHRIEIPESGFFAAIEGIFPGDYDFFYENDPETSEKDINKEDEFDGETISYGQQIGYTGGVNNTWHYSMDGNWFQLKKKRFNAMISAEIKIIRKTKKEHRFPGFLRRNKLKLDN